MMNDETVYVIERFYVNDHSMNFSETLFIKSGLEYAPEKPRNDLGSHAN